MGCLCSRRQAAAGVRQASAQAAGMCCFKVALPTGQVLLAPLPVCTRPVMGCLTQNQPKTHPFGTSWSHETEHRKRGAMGSSAHVHGKRIVAVVILVEMVALLPGQAATETETSSSIHSPGTTAGPWCQGKLRTQPGTHRCLLQLCEQCLHQGQLEGEGGSGGPEGGGGGSLWGQSGHGGLNLTLWGL